MLCLIFFLALIACFAQQTCPPKRRDYACMTQAQRTRFANAYLSISSSSSPLYPQLQALIQSHAAGFSQMHTPDMFLPFHKYYLDQIEQMLRVVDPCVSLPYWNYGSRPMFPFLNPPFGPLNMGGDGVPPSQCVQDGPFRFPWIPPVGSTCLTRQLSNVFPTGSQFAGLFLNPDYLSFALALQALHNLAHVSIGGNALTVLSPDEPLFWLLHAYTDYVWSQAMAQNPDAFSYPFSMSTLIPFGHGATVGQVMANVPRYQPSRCRFTRALHTPVMATKCYTHDSIMNHIFNTHPDQLVHIPQNEPRFPTEAQEKELLSMWDHNPWEQRTFEERSQRRNDSLVMLQKLRMDTERLKESITTVSHEDLLFGFDMEKLVDTLHIEPNCYPPPAVPTPRPTLPYPPTFPPTFLPTFPPTYPPTYPPTLPYVAVPTPYPIYPTLPPTSWTTNWPPYYPPHEPPIPFNPSPYVPPYVPPYTPWSPPERYWPVPPRHWPTPPPSRIHPSRPYRPPTQPFTRPFTLPPFNRPTPMPPSRAVYSPNSQYAPTSSPPQYEPSPQPPPSQLYPTDKSEDEFPEQHGR